MNGSTTSLWNFWFPCFFFLPRSKGDAMICYGIYVTIISYFVVMALLFARFHLNVHRYNLALL
jgi:hypothetical protein